MHADLEMTVQSVVVGYSGTELEIRVWWSIWVSRVSVECKKIGAALYKLSRRQGNTVECKIVAIKPDSWYAYEQKKKMLQLTMLLFYIIDS